MTREKFVDRWSQGFFGLAEEPFEFVRDLNALLDAERAAAREEQREADVAALLAPAREKDPGLDRDHPEEVHAARVRRAALTATPLADRIAGLEADSRLCVQLCEVLGREVGKTGESEGAVDVAKRIIRERDEACITAVRIAALCVQWKERAEKAEAKMTRITTDVLAGLSAAGVATPERGYEAESWAISGDIDRLAKGRDEWKERAEKAESALRDTAEAQREACAKAVDLSPEDEADFYRLVSELGAIADRSNLDDILATIRATPLVTDEGKR